MVYYIPCNQWAGLLPPLLLGCFSGGTPERFVRRKACQVFLGGAATWPSLGFQKTSGINTGHSKKSSPSQQRSTRACILGSTHHGSCIVRQECARRSAQRLHPLLAGRPSSSGPNPCGRLGQESTVRCQARRSRQAALPAVRAGCIGQWRFAERARPHDRSARCGESALRAHSCMLEHTAGSSAGEAATHERAFAVQASTPSLLELQMTRWGMYTSTTVFLFNC